MNCHSNEELLLLHAHGQLGPFEQLTLAPHLLLCAECRATLRAMQATSLLLMRASTVPGEARRRNYVFTSLGLSAGLRAWIALFAIASVIAVSFLGWHLVHASAMPPIATHSLTTKGCTPGLPSDHCR